MTDLCENENFLNKEKLNMLNNFLKTHVNYLSNDLLKKHQPPNQNQKGII